MGLHSETVFDFKESRGVPSGVTLGSCSLRKFIIEAQFPFGLGLVYSSEVRIGFWGHKRLRSKAGKENREAKTLAGSGLIARQS
jgi:hypothetical protein